MGSVKDLEVVKKTMKDETGIARFRFSDRYSVFDWGEMPDLIEEKGAALCIMSAYFFERLEEKGIKTHYRGLVQNGRLVTTDRLKRPCNVMEIDFVNVFHPTPYREAGKLKYDYSMFTPNLTNFLIPLEIMYRNSLLGGSTVFKRLKQGLKPEDLGLDHYPNPGEKLKEPILDVSTKLEESDRYVTWSEAQSIAGLTDEETVEIKAILLEANGLITKIASRANLTNEDGKVELAFDPQRKLILVDAIGTLDECRFTYKGFHVSKEIARQYYRKTKWYRNVEKAKREADAKGIKDWKSLCKSQPPHLDPALEKIICNAYKAATNELTEPGLFDVSSLADVIEEYQTYLGEQK